MLELVQETCKKQFAQGLEGLCYPAKAEQAQHVRNPKTVENKVLQAVAEFNSSLTANRTSQRSLTIETNSLSFPRLEVGSAQAPGSEEDTPQVRNVSNENFERLPLLAGLRASSEVLQTGGRRNQREAQSQLVEARSCLLVARYKFEENSEKSEGILLYQDVKKYS